MGIDGAMDKGKDMAKDQVDKAADKAPDPAKGAADAAADKAKEQIDKLGQVVTGDGARQRCRRCGPARHAEPSPEAPIRASGYGSESAGVAQLAEQPPCKR